MAIPERSPELVRPAARAAGVKTGSGRRSERRPRAPSGAGPEFSLELVSVRPGTPADDAEVELGPVEVRRANAEDDELDLAISGGEEAKLAETARSLNYLLFRYDYADAPRQFLEYIVNYPPVYRLRIRRMYAVMFHADVYEQLLARMREEEEYPREYIVSLALLRGQEQDDPTVRLAARLIPEANQQEVLDLLEHLPLIGRQQIRDRYNFLFEGLGFAPLDFDDALRVHLYHQLAQWAADKATAMLDHDLTSAEHLYFYLAPSGGDTAAATGLLNAAWSQGFDEFDRLVKDWSGYVNNGNEWLQGEPAFTAQDLLPFLSDRLNAGQLRLARQIWVAYRSHQELAGQIDALREGGVELTASERELELTNLDRQSQSQVLRAAAEIESGYFSRSSTESERAAGYTRQLNDRVESLRAELAQQGRGTSPELLRLREQSGIRSGPDETLSIVTSQLNSRGRTRTLLNFVRAPTLADRIYLAAQDGYGGSKAQEVLDLITDAWIKDQLDAVLADAARPVYGSRSGRLRESAQVGRVRDDPAEVQGDDVFIARPAYEPYRLLTGSSALFEKALPLLGRSQSRAQQGAARLAIEAKGGLKVDAENTYKFLSKLPDSLRGQVVNIYVADYNGLFKFEDSEAAVRLSQLLAGPARSAQDDLERQQALEETAGLAAGSKVNDSLAGLFDADAFSEKEAAFARYRRAVRIEREDPERLRRLAGIFGVRDNQQLFQLLSQEVERRRARVQQLRATTAQFVDTLLSIAGRSVIVALLGPVGLPNLLSALGGISIGALSHEFLLGPEYELTSRSNLAALVTEVVTFGFDELKIEDLIAEAFSADTLKLWFRIGSDENAEKFAAFVKEVGKTVSVNSLEAVTERGIADLPPPTLSESLARLVNISIIGLNKASFSELTKQNNVYTSFADRVRRNAQGVLLFGPPPKAALARAVGGVLAKAVVDPRYLNYTQEQIAQEILKAAAWSLFSSLSVSAALSRAQSRDANLLVDYVNGRAPAVRDVARLNQELASNRSFKEYYQTYTAYARNNGLRVLSPLELLRSQLSNLGEEGGFNGLELPSQSKRSKVLEQVIKFRQDAERYEP